MRAKDFWEIFPLPAKIKLFWDRITLTKTTTVYFVFSMLHCAVQVSLQVQAFHINFQAAHFIGAVTKQGNATNSDAFYVFKKDLRICDNVSVSLSTNSCQAIWDGNNTTVSTSSVIAPIVNTTKNTLSATMIGSNRSRPRSSSDATTAQKRRNQRERVSDKSTVLKRTLQSTIKAVEINDTVQVVVNGLGRNKESAILDGECLRILGWPVQVLENTKREDVTFIMFQIWVLGMSIVAILNESVPHIIATLLTHLVATGWAGFQIFNTIRFQSDFAELTTNGACHLVDLLPTYWRLRSSTEIASFVLDIVALLASAFLSWKLAKSFGWQTFKRIGSSPTISRIYKFVLTLSIVTQLSLFFIVTSVALWLDQLWNGAIGHLALNSSLHRSMLVITLILLPIWLTYGWYSVRLERKSGMLIFLLMCFGYLTGWVAMFASTTFRWTYTTWMFFAAMTTTSVLLTLLTFILGIICRFNFGKGLPQYLKSQEPTLEGFEPVLAEHSGKMDFPPSKLSTVSGTPSQVLPRVARPMLSVGQMGVQRPTLAITHAERAYPSLHRALSRSSIDSSKTRSSSTDHWC